jgi:hypothetical protein
MQIERFFVPGLAQASYVVSAVLMQSSSILKGALMAI